MAISLSSIKTGVSNDPPTITVWGDGGVGKTTFAANAPNPIFLFTEKGLGRLGVNRFTFQDADGSERYVANSFEEVMESLVALLGDHDYNTLVVDSLDWLESLVESYLLKMRPTTEKGRVVHNIKDYGFNQGATYILDYWGEYFDLIREIQKQKNMMVIQIAHREVVKITPPDADAYTEYNIKLDPKTREKFIESSDAVLYTCTKVATTEEEIGFNQTRKRAIGNGDKFVFTENRPSHEGKNRYNLPYQIPVKEKDWSDVWSILASHIPWFSTLDTPTKPEPAKKPAKAAEPVAETKPEEGKPDANLPKFLKTKGV